MPDDNTSSQAADGRQVGPLRKVWLALATAGLTGSIFGIVALSAPNVAFADTTCYTGCTAPPQSSTQSTEAVAPATSPSSSSLPFTGADVEQLVAIGGGAVIIGGLMVRRSRRRVRAAATAAVPGLSTTHRTVWSQWQSGSPTTQG